ncbi:MAG: DUF3098 domain-containing protein [Clostridium sp.]|nr:DUF3098 domain-containing protein [Clostridium sp.]
MKTLYDKRNYRLLALGYVLLLSGFLLMCGEGTTDEAFCPDIFSVRRIGVAPVVVLCGFLTILAGLCMPSGDDSR